MTGAGRGKIPPATLLLPATLQWWLQVRDSCAPTSIPHTVRRPPWASSPQASPQNTGNVQALKQPRNSPSNATSEAGIGTSEAGIGTSSRVLRSSLVVLPPFGREP
ncbi:hypothetical protein [Ferrimicrobium sp.]|uniref:hypothetical protein n=1 Tax=Ferrimicrobium sp. TaxID=2926050 RepID=UPI002608E449|nr:hypothetical protein [Ferrimicrobium sp.]